MSVEGIDFNKHNSEHEALEMDESALEGDEGSFVVDEEGFEPLDQERILSQLRLRRETGNGGISDEVA